MPQVTFRVNREESIVVPVFQVLGLRDRLRSRLAESAFAAGDALERLLDDPTVDGVSFEADEMSEILATIQFYMGQDDWVGEQVTRVRHDLRDAHDHAGSWDGVTLTVTVARDDS